MPRIRCNYEGCIHLEGTLCTADEIELDQELGCLTFSQVEEDAVAGIEVGTELAMQSVDDAKIARAVLISRMDRENANFDQVMNSLHEAFHSDIVPLMLPVGAHASFMLEDETLAALAALLAMRVSPVEAMSTED